MVSKRRIYLLNFKGEKKRKYVGNPVCKCGQATIGGVDCGGDRWQFILAAISYTHRSWFVDHSWDTRGLYLENCPSRSAASHRRFLEDRDDVATELACIACKGKSVFQLCEFSRMPRGRNKTLVKPVRIGWDWRFIDAGSAHRVNHDRGKCGCSSMSGQ